MLNSCDTMIVRNVDGTLFFAKNSDRPLEERQELRRRNDCVGGHLAWGGEDRSCFEWAFNAHGVVIGNEAIPTLVPEDEEGELPFGMYILADTIEIARSAKEAVDVIVQAVKERGQGKFRHPLHKTYDNAFLICDGSGAAYHVECYGRECDVYDCTKEDVYAISNVCRLSKFRHLWGPDTSGGFRSARAASLLSSARQEKKGIDLLGLMEVLRDHEGKVSLCMHAGDWGNTASSIVGNVSLGIYFAQIGQPCKSIFVPVSLDCVPDHALWDAIKNYNGPRDVLLQLERDFVTRASKIDPSQRGEFALECYERVRKSVARH